MAHPHLVEALLKRGKADSEIISFLLSKTHSTDHPEWVAGLIEKGELGLIIAFSVLPMTPGPGNGRMWLGQT